jgi:hypothetical protein
MTHERRWLDELPLGSAERELLVAGKAARPRGDEVDAGWRAFSSATSGTASAAARAGAGHAFSAKAASGVAATKASAASLLSVATVKSFAVGIALGVGVSAAGALVERVHPRQALPASVARGPLASRARQKAAPPRGPVRVAEPVSLAPVPAVRERGGTAEVFPRAAPHAATVPASNPAPSVARRLEAASAPSGPSLSVQARELARVKRLLDAGATAEALRGLAASFSAGESNALSEERDALYVQALARAGRGAEARARAREFLSRYPRSPYVDRIRRLGDE